MFPSEVENENFYLYKPTFLEVFVNSKVAIILTAFLVATFLYAFIVFSIINFKTMAFLMCCFVYMVCVIICYGFLVIIIHMSLSVITAFRRAFKLNVRYIKGDDSLNLVVDATPFETTSVEDSEEEIDDIPSKVLNLVERYGAKQKMKIINEIWGVKSGKKYQIASKVYDGIVKAKTSD